MRRPEALSPSGLDCYKQNPIEYYIRYLSDTKVPSPPQTTPMSIGSAFDAYVKSFLHEKLYGKNAPDSGKYEIKTIFDAQVEPQNRDFAWEAGKYVFEKYNQSGALADLMIELNESVSDPRFELDIRGVVSGYREGITKMEMGVPLRGKPDLLFINKEGAHVVYDWKVNGFCGNYNTSPMQGYIQLREDCGGGSWNRKGQHKGCVPQRYRGMVLNVAGYLEIFDPKWAAQLATYSWLLGEPVGAETIVGIDQIACNGSRRDPSGHPTLRIASHRCRVSETYQFRVMAEYQELWSIITAPEEKFYFFRDVSFEESKLRCKTLDGAAEVLKTGGDSDETWVMAMGVGREV